MMTKRIKLTIRYSKMLIVLLLYFSVNCVFCVPSVGPTLILLVGSFDL